MAVKRFSTHPTFTPDYSPLDMLSMGVFGGAFFNKITHFQGIPQSVVREIRTYPTRLWAAGEPIADTNHFGVLVEKRNRDIPVPIKLLNPAGWYQWYFSFYYGKRGMSDKYRVYQWEREKLTLLTMLRGSNPATKAYWKQALLEIGVNSDLYEIPQT